MQARSDPDGSLVLTYDSTRLSRLLFGFALIAIATGAYDYFVGARGTERLIGLVGGAATCVGAGVLCLEQAFVRIDPRARTIDWTRRWGFRRHSGSLPFGEVETVVPERVFGDEGAPSRRIVIKTNTGKAIPLTAGYHVDPDDELFVLVDRILELMGKT